MSEKSRGRAFDLQSTAITTHYFCSPATEGSLTKAQARERLWGRPDHMKRLLPSSRFSWR
ncbi:hypothetical protein N7540_009413 [Penicillium herquei]|nr:hypothetical protein N7540_009413 [Penicillium herquei]